MTKASLVLSPKAAPEAFGEECGWRDPRSGKTWVGGENRLDRMKDDSPFGLGGLWENWKDPTSGEWVRTFAIITTDANELVADIHDRIPLILAPADYVRWLSLLSERFRQEIGGPAFIALRVFLT